jgi:DNA-binding MarR family transcriptional regulator
MSKPISPLEAHVGYWMRLVSNHVSHAFRLKLEEQGVTVAEWVVLRQLVEQGQIAPSALAQSLGLTRGAVSKLVERLVSKGLVTRDQSEADRRYQALELTSSGRRLVPRLAHLADENDAEYFGYLTDGQRQELIALLRSIAERRQLKEPPLT